MGNRTPLLSCIKGCAATHWGFRNRSSADSHAVGWGSSIPSWSVCGDVEHFFGPLTQYRTEPCNKAAWVREGLLGAQPGGGQPADLGNLYLCTRADTDPDRFFNGSIAHLQLYNEAVAPNNVSALYTSYISTGELTANASFFPQIAPAALDVAGPIPL